MSTVTLKDVARECGVSFSSVSKALKGSPEIGQATIKLVVETAARMGYHPNSAARALRTNRSYDIGVVFEDSTGSGLQHQYFAEIFDSINVSANLAGYSITFLNSMNKIESSYMGQALQRGCDGVIIVSTQDFERDDIKSIFESKIPVSVLDYSSCLEKRAVMSDNYSGMTALVEYAISKGHKKIAFIHGENSAVTEMRLKAFTDTLKNHGIEVDESLIKTARYYDASESERITETLLCQSDRPTCIFYPDDFAYLGGLRTLAKFGLKPGTDISTVGYDGILLSSLLSVPLTTYAQNAKELGSTLVKSLISQIKGTEGERTTFISGKLIEGESVAQI